MSTSLLPTRSAQRALTLFLVALITLAAGEAWACAACACGDPTLTTLGADQPFEGRLRAGTLVRAWGYSDGVSHGDYGEVRMDLAAAYSPLSWLTLSAQLPLQVRGGSAGTPARRDRGRGLGLPGWGLARRVRRGAHGPGCGRQPPLLADPERPASPAGPGWPRGDAGPLLRRGRRHRLRACPALPGSAHQLPVAGERGGGIGPPHLGHPGDAGSRGPPLPSQPGCGSLPAPGRPLGAHR